MRDSVPPSGVADLRPDAVPPGPEFALPALRPLGWLFVVGAVLLVVVRLRLSISAPTWLAAGLPNDLAEGLAALLPAALLFRLPDAPRTQPLLFAGLAIGAALEWASAAQQYLPPELGVATPLAAGLAIGLDLAMAAASLAVGLGLLRLRRQGPTRGWLLGVFVAIDVGYMLAELGLPAAAAHQVLLTPSWLLAFLLFALVGSASALASWVAVSAWLDRDTPRAFWTLLALGFPLGLLAKAASLGTLIPLLTPPLGDIGGNGLYLAAIALSGLFGAAGTLLALLAYSRAAPRDSVPLDA